jgi:rubrerythrin
MLHCIIESMRKELDAAECYYAKGIYYKDEQMNVATVYFDIATQELEHFNKFHALGVSVLTRMKNEGSSEIDTEKIIWDYEHDKLIRIYEELKYKISKLNA